MSQLRYLEFKRLMKELQFVESDLEYQSEILKISDEEFIKSVNNFLTNYPELEQIYQQKKETFEKILLENKIEIKEEIQEKNILPEAKKLYRKIVKSTHPDKVINNKLNELYKLATQAYDDNDMITLYKVLSELEINFEIDDNLILEIKDKVDSLKSQTNLLKSTFTYRWVKCNSTNEKNKIILEFIKTKII